MEASMSGIAIALVLAGALALAIHNVLSKLLQRADWQNRSAFVTTLAMLGAASLLFAYSLATGGPQVSADWLFPVLATGVLNIGIMYAKIRARALEDVSLVTPIDSATPAVVIVTAMIIVGEYPTGMGWIGIWVLVVGTYILNIQEFLQHQKSSTRWDKVKAYLAPFLMLGKSAGVRWAFLAVGLSTLSLPYDGLVARRADIGFGFGLVCAIAGLGNLPMAIIKKEYRTVRVKEAVLRALALGSTFAIATVLFGLAYRFSLVAYVGTMKRLTIPATIILAYLLLGEKKSFRQRIVGGSIMAVGAVLIALAK